MARHGTATNHISNGKLVALKLLDEERETDEISFITAKASFTDERAQVCSLHVQRRR